MCDTTVYFGLILSHMNNLIPISNKNILSKCSSLTKTAFVKFLYYF